MEKLVLNSPTNERQQYAAFGVLSLAVIGLTGILILLQDTITKPYLGIIPGNPAGFFQPFIGNFQPLLATALIAVVGGVTLGFLQSRGRFEIYKMRASARGVAVAAIIATSFGIVMIVADLTFARQPVDINVPPPWSWLFYPVIAYAVEILFHVIPLALLLAVLGLLFKKLNLPGLVWLCILLVSLLEPLVQTTTLGMSAYVGLHVFAFTLAQLYIFRRYDFISMYTFRIVYYVCWHIIWGYLRLQGLG